MKLEDWHTHSALCHHAVGSIEDYIRKAIELELNTIGICDHFPFEFLKKIERIPYENYAMTLDEIKNYLSTVESLKEKSKKTINVRIAFEVDFVENQESTLNIHLCKYKHHLDYILGSIHLLNFHDGRGAWAFDDSRFKNDYNYYGSDKVYMEYYKTVQKMLNSNDFDFDIIAHFDLPKKFNDIPNNKEKVNNEVMKTLGLIKKRDVVMEINSSGLRKDAKEQYPSKEIIQEMYDLDIPILLGSDAHDPIYIAWEFENIINMLKKIGYNHLVHFKKRNRTYIEI
ncbi:MAG: histidinol-phosphatase HisJ [Promethearchaeota archaeon]